MKTLLTVLTFGLMTSVAQADGFVCYTTEGDLSVKIFNNTDADQGTRNAAIMILSDNTIQQGNRTIASFSDVKNTLTQEGATYTAAVDLRVKESNRQGEYVAGTRLGYVKYIVADIDFTYAAPVQDGAKVFGALHFVKRNGDITSLDLVCARYLKN